MMFTHSIIKRLLFFMLWAFGNGLDSSHWLIFRLNIIKQLPAQNIPLLGDTPLPFPWEHADVRTEHFQFCCGTTCGQPVVPLLGLSI
jgi:hypothetical protein